jgi:hypothetical protein
MIFGMTPGPQFIKNSPDLFWGLVASMYVGNVLLLVLNLPLIPLWVKVLRVPFILLNVIVLLFCVIGAYSIGQDVEDIYLVLVFGLVGLLTKKLAYEPAPLILAFILGPMIENNLRQSLIVSNGSFTVFVTRPVSAFFLAIALFIVITAVIKARRATGKYSGKVKDSESRGTVSGDRVSSLFGLLFGVFITLKSAWLGVGGVHRPGPGFFPLLDGILLAVLSAVLLSRSLLIKGGATAGIPTGEKEKLHLVAYAFIGTLVYASIFEWIGFLISTFVLMIFLLKLLDPKKWWITIVTAGLISSSAYVIFNVLLKSGLPKGILEDFL